MELILRRIESDGKEVLGLLSIYKGSKLVMLASTLEPSFEGEPKIALGDHELIKYFSPKHQTYVWKFNNKDEKDRYFELHVGNYFKDSDGCVLLGNGFANVDNDNEIDLINSRGMLKKFMKLTAGVDKLNILVVKST